MINEEDEFQKLINQRERFLYKAIKESSLDQLIVGISLALYGLVLLSLEIYAFFKN